MADEFSLGKVITTEIQHVPVIPTKKTVLSEAHISLVHQITSCTIALVQFLSYTLMGAEAYTWFLLFCYYVDIMIDTRVL